MTTPQHTPYAPGHAQVQHHEWRTAENSAAHLLPHLARAVRANPALHLLDVGAGPGTLTASLAEHLGPRGHVTAADISADVLARARAHAEARGVAGMMTFVPGADVYALPFADGAFDVVHAHQVLTHLDAPVDAVREMLRVTRPVGEGGIIALREADLRAGWCLWPEIPALARFWDLLADVQRANHGQDRAGRQLVSWVMAAGVPRANIEASFGSWCYSEPEDRRAWGEAMIQRLVDGPLRAKALELGLATKEDLDGMVKGWEEWMAAEDATLGIMNGEVIVRKPPLA